MDADTNFRDAGFHGLHCDAARKDISLWQSLWKGRYFDALPANIFETIQKALDGGEFFRTAYDKRTLEVGWLEVRLSSEKDRADKNWLALQEKNSICTKIESELKELRAFRDSHRSIETAQEKIRQAAAELKNAIPPRRKRSRKSK